MSTERLNRLITASERGQVLPESRDYEDAELSADEAEAAVREIESDPQSRWFHVLMTLRRAARPVYDQLPAAARAQVLVDTLSRYRQVNDFGYLDPHGGYDGPAAIALMEAGDAAVPPLVPLLSDDRPGPLSGSEEATMAKLYGYRRMDFAFRYLSKLTGREAPFDEDPSKRDEAIARLSRELGDANVTAAKRRS